MQETLEQTTVDERAKRGIGLLLGRQALLQVFTFSGGVVLARVLTPAEFGLYAIVTFLVNTLALFGDFGLVPALVQRKNALTDRDLAVGFTIQQISTTVIVVLLLLAAPFLVHLYPKAPPQMVALLRILACALYLESWRSISVLQMERQLTYDRLAQIEVAEGLTYQGLAVILAVSGFGVWSFVLAASARGLLGAIWAYQIAPWRLRFAFDKQIATQILRFGLPFQMQNVANQSANWVMPLLVGSLIGPQAVGFLTWAASNGKKPLMLVDCVMRVAFPHISRIQEDRLAVERIVRHYLTLLFLASGWWFAVIFVAGASIVHWIYGIKWVPAVPALILYSATLGFDVVSWVVGVSLNGLGLVKTTTRVVFIRTLFNIPLTIMLVFLIGTIGVPTAFLLSSVLSVPLLFQGFGVGGLKRILGPTAWIVLPILFSVVAGAAVSLIPSALPWRVLLTTVCVTVVYGIATYAFGRKNIQELLPKRWRSGSLVAVEG